MIRRHRYRAGAIALAVVSAVVLAACGSSSSSSSSKTTAAAPKSSTATSGSPAAAASGPGVGKPPVTIGDKNFEEEYVLGALYAHAQAHGLTSDADLKKLGKSVKLGGAPEFATRYQGLVGLKKAYGDNPTFVPLAIGLTYKALDTGQVQVSDVFTTDPQ